MFPAMDRRLTTLGLLNKVDAFPTPEKDPKGHEAVLSTLYTLVWEDDDGAYPIGYMPTAVFEELKRAPSDIRGPMEVHPETRTVKLFWEATTEAERTKLVAGLTAYWRANQTFQILKGWRNELWPVYSRSGEVLFSMERAAMGLFGTTRFGVHMTAFIRRDDGKSKYDFRIWVPKRAANKSTFPSMLDNTVAGGLMTNEDPFECVIREADEEASLPESIVRSRAIETGTVTYIYITDDRSGGAGYIYPECQWVYDLELPIDGSVVPEPKDGEVDSFTLRTVEEIQDQLAQGLWKPNCAVVILDFFLRHGIYTPENEPDIEEIRARAHRYIPFPGPHQNYQPPSTEEVERRRRIAQ